jgi:hypothetical protein
MRLRNFAMPILDHHQDEREKSFAAAAGGDAGRATTRIPQTRRRCSAAAM